MAEKTIELLSPAGDMERLRMSPAGESSSIVFSAILIPLL